MFSFFIQMGIQLRRQSSRLKPYVRWFNSICPHHCGYGLIVRHQSSKLIMRVQFPLLTPSNVACLGGEEVVLKTIGRLFDLQVRILCATPCGCRITVSTLPCQDNSEGSIPFIHSKIQVFSSMVEQSTFQPCVGSTPTLISGMTGSGQQALCDGVTGNWSDSNKTYQCFLNSTGRVLSLQDRGYRFKSYREHQWQCGVMVSQEFAKLPIVYSVYQFDSGLCRQVKYQRSKAVHKHFTVSDINYRK